MIFKYHLLNENWLRHWTKQTIDLERVHPIVNIVSSIDIAEKIETSNTYVAGSIGYEFVICTTMHHRLFAILQQPHEHVRIHELNIHDGHLIHNLKLDKAKANQTFLCGTTTTFYDRKMEKELFAIGLQSGLIFIIDTDPLGVYSTIQGRRFLIFLNETVF